MSSSSDDLIPGGHTQEEIDKAIAELKSLGYTVYSPDNETRVQCFLCNQWQTIKYTKPIKFNELEEPVCLGCVAHLYTREDNLESKRLEAEI